MEVKYKLAYFLRMLRLSYIFTVSTKGKRHLLLSRTFFVKLGFTLDVFDHKSVMALMFQFAAAKNFGMASRCYWIT